MKVFNTLTRQKEELIPLEPGKVRIYACGPTVYNFIHIGNARPICVFDVLRRYLESRGYEVNFVQNFTAVSYTHLDVYKRQLLDCRAFWFILFFFCCSSYIFS